MENDPTPEQMDLVLDGVSRVLRDHAEALMAEVTSRTDWPKKLAELRAEAARRTADES